MTVEIPLTQGRFALVDDEDSELMLSFKWHAKTSGRNTYAYRYIRREDGSKGVVSMHSTLTGFAETDHVNHDGLDNRRANLREVTRSQNNQNMRLRLTSRTGLKGVSWHKRDRRYQARIQVNGELRHLGYHLTAEDAGRAYDAAAREAFGEYAHLNFPSA